MLKVFLWERLAVCLGLLVIVMNAFSSRVEEKVFSSPFPSVNMVKFLIGGCLGNE